MSSSQTFQRYAAIGDSFTEGCGDPAPDLPNGVRGWADRVAEVLADRAVEAGQPFAYANLAIRGRKLDHVLAEQVEPALAMQPDLLTCYAGANDILRPRVDLDALMRRYQQALQRFADAGTHLVLFTAADPGGALVYRPVRARFERYGERVREIAGRLGADVVDFWAMKEYQDWGWWDADRMHMASPGHQRMAAAVLDVLGIDHGLPPTAPGPGRPTALLPRLVDDAAWARRDLLPWVGRRLTGVSSGDACRVRWPAADDAVAAG